MLPQINIRKAIITDMSKLHDCNKRNLPISYSTVELLFMHMSSYNSIFIAQDISNINNTDKIVGYLLSEYDGTTCHIMSLGVDVECRRLGVATNLLLQLSKEAKQWCKTLSLYVQTNNTSAINFYKKNGFKKVSKIKGYYSTLDNTDAYIMHKQI